MAVQVVVELGPQGRKVRPRTLPKATTVATPYPQAVMQPPQAVVVAAKVPRVATGFPTTAATVALEPRATESRQPLRYMQAVVAEAVGTAVREKQAAMVAQAVAVRAALTANRKPRRVSPTRVLAGAAITPTVASMRAMVLWALSSSDTRWHNDSKHSNTRLHS
jgi:hypothetical protein